MSKVLDSAYAFALVLGLLASLGLGDWVLSAAYVALWVLALVERAPVGRDVQVWIGAAAFEVAAAALAWNILQHHHLV